MRRDASLIAIGLVACGSLVMPLEGKAQPNQRVARIGYLSTDPARFSPYIDEFQQGLRDLGYVEGRSLTIEWRFAGEAYDRLPALAAELVDLKVDVIVADSSLAAVAAKQATKTVPIVMTVIAGGQRDGNHHRFTRHHAQAAPAAQGSRSDGLSCGTALESHASRQSAPVEGIGTRGTAAPPATATGAGA